MRRMCFYSVSDHGHQRVDPLPHGNDGFRNSGDRFRCANNRFRYANNRFHSGNGFSGNPQNSANDRVADGSAEIIISELETTSFRTRFNRRNKERPGILSAPAPSSSGVSKMGTRLMIPP